MYIDIDIAVCCQNYDQLAIVLLCVSAVVYSMHSECLLYSVWHAAAAGTLNFAGK